jgi:hypothetical protein
MYTLKAVIVCYVCTFFIYFKQQLGNLKVN